MSSSTNRSPYIAQTIVLDGHKIPVISDLIRKLLAEAEGPIPYPLTNDRAFRGIVSYSETIRKGLAAILMDKSPDEIWSADIMNPISFGENVREKETESDVKLLVNDTSILNVEMQNINLLSNNKRFLTYLCRNFTTSEAGKDYNDLKPSLLVGIANYTVDRNRPEFYTQYRIQNKKTGQPLFPEDDFFGFNILDLNSSRIADESDRKSGRVLLARLCKAATWEELRQLGRESAFAKEVAEIMYVVNADTREKWRLEAARLREMDEVTLRNERDRAVKQAAEAEAKAAKAIAEAETKAKETEAKAEAKAAKAIAEARAQAKAEAEAQAQAEVQAKAEENARLEKEVADLREQIRQLKDAANNS